MIVCMKVRLRKLRFTISKSGSFATCVVCNAGVPIRGEQKAAAGEGEGLKNGEGGGEGGPRVLLNLDRMKFSH